MKEAPRKLIEILRSRPDGARLASNLENIERESELLLSKIVVTFPEFTEHDVKHSRRALVVAESVFPDSLKEGLNTYEIFFLIASAYLHDVGMVNLPELLDEGKLESTDKEVAKEHIRENHHLRSEKFITRHCRDLRIENEHEARIIGRICRGHRKEDLHDHELYEPDKMYKGSPINVPLLSAILRLSDELDLTFERAPIVVYEHLSPKDPISVEEWQKHLSISGVGLHPDDPLTIKCSATCKSPKIHRLLKRLEIKINRELEDLPYHLHQYRECRKDIARKFLLNIETEGYKAYDFKFSLQENEIVNLLLGERLYKRREESLRELLKNSVDACRAKRELLRKQGMNYTPEIVFELAPDRSRLIIADNGLGMDEDIVDRYFTKIGRSFYTSSDFLEKKLDFTPVSELGIGFLSCFMIADKIEVETKADDSNPLLLEIDDVSDYFTVHEGKRNTSGTQVTLHLKDSSRDIDLLKEISHYSRHLEFPVIIRSTDKHEQTIDDEGYERQCRQYLNDLPFYIRNFHTFHITHVKNELVEGVVATLFKQNPIVGCVPEDTFSITGYDREPLVSNMSLLSIEGVFVSNTSILPDWLTANFVLVDLNFKRKAVDLNVARNEILSNEKLIRIKKLIEPFIIDTYEKFLSDLENKVAKDEFPRLSTNFLSRYVRLHHDRSVLGAALDLMRKYSYLRCVSADGISNVRFSDIVKSGKSAVLLKYIDQYSEAQIKEIFTKCPSFRKDVLYIMHSNPYDIFAKLLIPSISSLEFLHFLKYEESYELKGLIPQTWRLVTFANYETTRFIEFSGYGETILNRNHRFVDLLARNKCLIEGDKRIALTGFFRSFLIELKSNFKRIVSKQKTILKWFVEAKSIPEDELSNYLLRKEDFPPHLLQYVISVEDLERDIEHLS